MRFELIDRVLEVREDRVHAVKHVTAGEEYLGDHFPAFPVLPGVLMLEALAQAGAELLTRNGLAERPITKEVRNLRLGAFVAPGETLRLEAVLRGERGEEWEFAGTATRENEQVAAQGRFRLGESPQAPESTEGAAR